METETNNLNGLDPLETTPFLGNGSTQQPDEAQPKKAWNRFIGIIISIIIGLYAGYICRTMQEAWVYSALFCCEAIICTFISSFFKTYNIRKTVSQFALYFLLSAISTVICCYFWIKYN